MWNSPALATGRRQAHRDIESAVVDEMLAELTQRKERLNHRKQMSAAQTKYTPRAQSPSLDPSTSRSRRALDYPRHGSGTPRSPERRRLFPGDEDEDDDMDEPPAEILGLPLTVQRIRSKMESMQEENARLRLGLERRRLRQERLEQQLHDENTMLAEMLSELSTVSRSEVLRRRAHQFERIELSTQQRRQRSHGYSPRCSPGGAATQGMHSAASSRLSGRAWLARYFRETGVKSQESSS